MNHSDIDESALRKPLLQAEQNLDDATLQTLDAVRNKAVAQQNNWLKDYYERFIAGYRGIFSASVLTAATAAVILLPAQNETIYSDSNLYAEDPVSLLMEDPEFYLWLNESGMLVAER